MLTGGETVLVAVSGGADSVALLHVLVTLAGELSLRLHALHVDHGLRPDSGADGAFVTRLADRLGVPADVVGVAVPAGPSLEATARAARYAALEAHAARLGAARIALGHTTDDQAETVLMRMLTGAGVRGLAGIPPVRGPIIRPLLETRRVELVALLEAAGLPWIEDPSNQDPRFFRNRVRHELLPRLRDAAGADVAARLDRLARCCRDTVDAIDRVARRELARLATIGADAVVLSHAPLAELPRPVAAEVLRQAAAALGGRAPLRAWAHRGLARILATPPPRRPFRLGGITVEVSSGRIRLATSPPSRLPARNLPIPGRVELPEIGRALQARLVGAPREVPRGPARVVFDAERLPARLTVRGRRPGDRFAPFGGGERRLKSFLIDAKIPRWDRVRLPVVDGDGRILWIAGVRRSSAAPVTAATRHVLELSLEPLA
jgi:tRNA(Ile)-lysidine synthase